jgi:imidazolonepropionase
MDKIITNISHLLHINLEGKRFKRGKQLKGFPTTSNAWLSIKDGCVENYGSMNDLPSLSGEVIDAKGGMVLPTWVDSHTHLIYAGTREDEFGKRLHGMSYEQIANEGGGILNSANKLRKASEDELYEAAANRLTDVMRMGTGAIEIKSGYGLSTDSEIKMLKVAQRLKNNFDLPVKSTFLGAHAFPKKFKDDHQAYVDLIINEMLPEIARENLADYIDVFCEEGYFSTDEMVQILEAAAKFNIKSKLHLNQFNILNSIELAHKHDAVSVDHLEVMSENDLQVLSKSNTIATLLPGCSLFLEIPYAPARKLIEGNSIVALATDYNPGSAPSGNMGLMVSLGCIKMKMTPEEAISAATLNGAAAIEISDRIGSIEKGKLANLIITKPHVNTPSFLPYNFGHNPIEKVLIKGEIL